MYIKKPSYLLGLLPLRIPLFRLKLRLRREEGAAPGESQSVGLGQIYHTTSHDDRRSERRRVSLRLNGDDTSMRRLRSQGRSRHDDDEERRERRERRLSRYADDEERRERRDRRHSRSHRDRDRDEDDRRERRRSERGLDRHADRRKLTSSRKPASKSLRSGGGAAAAAPSKPKVVLPTNVEYRPGRIQLLTAEQERIHKQYWAYFLAYWGYDIGFDPHEVKYLDVFVALTGRPDASGGAGLSRTATHNSLQLGNTLALKKKKGWLGGSGGSTLAAPASQHHENHAPANSPRMQDIQTKLSQEQFIPTDVPSPDVVNVFVNHYKLVLPEYYKETEDDGASSDVSDAALVESFVTADTTITNPDDFPTELYSKRGGGGGTLNGAMLSAPAASNKPVKLVNVNPDLAGITPTQWQQMFMSACRNDLPDNFLLRFMRARKWNTENALKMLSKLIKWRMDFPADQWVLESDGPLYLTGKNAGFIKNLTTEKLWIKGLDFQKSPIFWFQAKKHFGSDLPSDETQRYAVTTIEWVRLFLREVSESVDTVSIVFDLTGFTLKNADYTTIKFLAEVFEAHYPECLGRIYVHNAPWIFSTVWNIIKNWLDPVVASKIVFTKNFKDLSGYIAPEFVPTDLGGIDTSGPLYPIPKAGDDRPPKAKDATYVRLRKERDILFMRFLDCTAKWVGSTNPDVSAKYLEEKTIINVELLNNWIALQGYIRNPSPYDRIGNLQITN